MTYEVLARKWRPKSFKELIGQDSVRTTLINSIKYNRLHPVLLFTGPRGTGKTSAARIFAKTLRCKKKKDFAPCGQCEDCTLIQQGKSLDVIEIDGASHNGVEAVRSLRETIHYMPTSGTYKIYIIDEVHMLSTAAFNALLKTLEEPPKHVFFIMATTESQKIPTTVISRSQKLDFYLIPQQTLKDHLQKIAKEESISIQDEALWLITKQAQGSLRDGQSLLDQMTTFCDGEITEAKIVSVLGLTERNLLLKTLQSVIERKESDLLQLLNEIYTKGCDPNLFIQELIESIRNLILLKVNPSNSPVLVHASDQEIQQLKSLNENLSYEDIHLFFDMTLKGEREVASCYDNRLALEVFLLRLSQAPRLEEIAPFQNKKQEPVAKKEIPKAKAKETSSAKPISQTSPSLKQEPVARKEIPKAKETSSAKPISQTSPSLKQEPVARKEIPKAKETSSAKPISQTSPSLKQEPVVENAIEEAWFHFIDTLKTTDPKQAVLVECLALKEWDQNHFTLYLSNRYSFLKNQIFSSQKQIEEGFSRSLNRNEKITIDIKETDQYFPILGDRKRASESEKLVKEVSSDPFLQKVNKIFKSEIKTLIHKDTSLD